MPCSWLSSSSRVHLGLGFLSGTPLRLRNFCILPRRNPRIFPHKHNLLKQNDQNSFFNRFFDNLRQRDWKSLDKISSDLSPLDVINALYCCDGDSRLSLEFYRWIEDQRRLEFENSLDIPCTAAIVLSHAGVFDESRRILRSLLGKRVFPAVDIVEKLAEFYHGRKIRNTPVIFDIFINVYLEVKRVKDAIEALYLMLNYAFNPTTQSCNNLLDAVVKSEFVELAPKVFDEMKQRGICRSVYSFNIMIYGYCRLGLVDEAMKVLSLMRDEGVMPVASVYNVIINFFCKGGDLEGAERILRAMERDNVGFDSITFSTLMNGYIRGGNFCKARNLFYMMVGKGIRPTVSAYGALIDGFCKDGNVGKGRETLQEMIDNGFVPNVIVYNTLIDGFCKLGGIDGGVELLQEMSYVGCKPDLFTYSSLIKGFCDQGRMEEAVKLFNRIVSEGLAPDLVIYNTMIDGYCKIGNLNRALRIGYEMMSVGVALDAISYNILISGASHNGGSQTINALIGRMLQQGLTPDFVTYSTMAETYCKERNIEDCLGIIKVIEKQGFVAHSQDFKHLVCILCEEGNRHGMRSFLLSVREDGSGVDVTLYNSFIGQLCNAGKMGDAFLLCDEMVGNDIPPDVNTCNFLMSGFFRLNDVWKCIKVFREMCKHGIVPNAHTYMILNQIMKNQGLRGRVLEHLNKLLEGDLSGANVEEVRKNCHILVLKGLIYAGNISKAYNLLTEVSVTYSGSFEQILVELISEACKENKVSEAMQLFTSLSAEGILPNISTINILLRSLYKLGRVEEANRILSNVTEKQYQSMININAKPNAVTYNNLLSEFCKRGCMEDALQILNHMKRKGIPLNSRAYSSMVCGYCKQGNLEEAFNIYETMIQKSIPVGPSLYNVLIGGLCHKSKVLEACAFLNKLIEKGHSPNAETYNILIGCSCKEGDFRCSFDLVHEAFERNIFPDRVICTALLCGLCKRREMTDATKLWHMMLDNGFFGDEFMFNSMIVGYCQVGNMQEALCLLCQMLRKGFSCDRFTSGILLHELKRGNHFEEAFQFLGFTLKSNILLDESACGLLIDESLIERKIGAFDSKDQMLNGVGSIGFAPFPGYMDITYEESSIREVEEYMGKRVSTHVRSDIYSFSSQTNKISGEEVRKSLMEALTKQSELGSTCKLRTNKKYADDGHEKAMKLREELLERGIL
ncbi:uncharacterized protein LOC143883975 [Tasmannia lanceolata]|uniref:uncharacterized protein LOC143883975 n=1 Tax=Tasmannia lanceolata TaxID=3420 RepID=UPI0040641938